MNRNNIYIKSLLLMVAVVMGWSSAFAQEGSGNWKRSQTDRTTELFVPANDAAYASVTCEEEIFFEDFGTSDPDVNFGRKVSPYMPSGSFAFGTPYPTSTNYDEYMIDNNYYAVVAPGYIKAGTDPNQYYFWTPAYNEANTVTDRSGTEEGAVMVINAGSTLLPFYQREYTVQSNTTYRASFWLYLVNGPSKVAIDVINKTTGEVLGTVESELMEDWNTTYKGQWTQHTLHFATPEITPDCNLSDVIISIRNAHEANFGNDYYIDDIKFSKLVCDIPTEGVVEIKCPESECAAGTEQVQLSETVLSNGAILDVIGEALFYEDFGTSNINNGDKGRVTSPFMPADGFAYGTSYLNLPTPGGNTWDDNPIRNQARLNDGHYAVVAPRHINEGWFPDDGWGSWWNIGVNDADDDPDGAVMVINAGDLLTPFYERNATVQVGAKYRVSFKLFVVQGPAQVGIDILDATTKDVLETMQSDQFGDDEDYKGTQWETISIDFTMGGNPCEIMDVIVSLRNHKAEHAGNDWYIDNIKFEKIEDAPLCPSGLECTDTGETSVNLNDAFSGTAPVGSELVWFKTKDRQPGTEVSDPENVTESGDYYAFFYDPIGECYNVDISIAKVTTVVLPPCKNYWMGGTPDAENEWDVKENWTANDVPEEGEDIEFATKDNYGTPAVADLYVPEGKTKIIGNLTNETITDGDHKVRSLVIPPNSGLIIHGETEGSTTDPNKIVVKASENESTGTLIFKNPVNNKEVQATVEFYNKAYTCPDCGYFRKGWQYFGIPVASAEFPYIPNEQPLLETIHKWDEPTNGNKWITPTTPLQAFVGYEINNKSTTKPDYIYKFKGELNVGNAEVKLSKTSNVNYSGMNLIANSFTAAIPISADAISYSDNSWDGQVYLFNTGTRDQWRKLNGGSTPNIVSGTYTSVPTNVAGEAGLPTSIPSMHTFMVNVPSTGKMTLDYSKLVKNEVAENQPAWRSAQSEKQEIPHIVLDVIGSNSADRVWLFEHAGTTRGFDAGWDGVKMPEKDIVQLYVAGEDNAENYQVATVPQMIGTSFGMQPDVNESYTLSVAVSADVEARGLFLRDMLTGRSYALKNGAEYKVQGSTKSDNRFKVVDTMLDESKLGDNPLIDIYVVDNQVVVANNSDEDCTVTLYDAAGKLVGKRAAARNSTVYMSNAGRVAGGVYVVKVAGTQQVNETKRVVVK